MIKQTLAAAAILVVATTAHADQNKLDTCNEYGKLATTIMEARQAGYPMRKLINGTDMEAARQLIVDAYGHPRYNSDKFQQRAIDDFANDAYLECFRLLD